MVQYSTYKSNHVELVRQGMLSPFSVNASCHYLIQKYKTLSIKDQVFFKPTQLTTGVLGTSS